MMTAKATSSQVQADSIVCVLRRAMMGTSRKVRIGTELRVDTDAEKRLLSASKRILESDTLKQIGSIQREAYAFLRERAGVPSPLLHKGASIVRLAQVEVVDATLQLYRQRMEGLVTQFQDELPGLIEQARTELGELWRPADYPNPSDLPRLFSLEWSFFEVGAPKSLKKVSPQVFEQEREKAAKAWDEALLEARATLREALLGLVEKLGTVLREPDKRFKKSTVENLSTWLGAFDTRNIADDTELAAVTEQLKSLLQGVDAQSLRPKDGTPSLIREQLARSLDTTQSQIQDLVEACPRRQFNFDED